MGKKYTTATATAAYNSNIEPMFEFSSYEGIKPSRAKAIVRHNAVRLVLEAELRAERVSNHKPKTDKQGKRPAVSVGVVGEKTAWERVGSVDTHGEIFSLFKNDAGYRIERTGGYRYGAKVETFSSIEEVEYWLGQYEFGCMERCAAVINLFERLMTSHSYDIECECTLCVFGKDRYQREFQRELEREYQRTNGTGGAWMYYGWGCPTCRK